MERRFYFYMTERERERLYENSTREKLRENGVEREIVMKAMEWWSDWLAAG